MFVHILALVNCVIQKNQIFDYQRCSQVVNHQSDPQQIL